MTHIWQGVQAASGWPPRRRGRAWRVTPACPLACLPCRQFTLSRCGVRQKIVQAPPWPPWRGSRKR